MASNHQREGENRAVEAVARPTGRHASRSLRRLGMVPAVVYGHGEPRAVALRQHDAQRIRHLPTTRAFALSVEGREETVRRAAVEIDPVSDRVLHLDLERVVQGERLRVAVPIEPQGVEELERRGGVVEHLLSHVEVEGALEALPAFVGVDVSSLAPGDQIVAGQLALPSGVRLLTQAHEPVLQIVAAQAEGPSPQEASQAESGAP
jgi:large subunit ribosomal protein L25